MSDYTDYMEEMFFAHVMNVRERIYSNRKWKEDYLSKRKNYPDWVTRDGKHIAIANITDSHLENLLKFLPNDNPWHTVFECEKKYRHLCDLEKENKENEKVIDLVY